MLEEGPGRGGIATATQQQVHDLAVLVDGTAGVRLGSGRAAHEALVELWGAGFREPSPYRVVEPFGYVPELGTLFQAQASGATWADRLTHADAALEQVSCLAAEWLLALQQVTSSGAVRPVSQQVLGIRRYAAELGAVFPEHAERLQAIARTVAARGAEDDGPAGAAHGDYHPGNVFVTDGRVMLIDFDTYGPRRPAFDVGYALGQLLIMSYLGSGRSTVGAAAGRAFWTRYARQGAARWPDVAAQVARTLLQSLH